MRPRSIDRGKPTLGTTVGTIAARTQLAIASVTQEAASAEYTFGDQLKGGRAIVLRGTSQVLAVNLGSTTITGGVARCTFEWTE